MCPIRVEEAIMQQDQKKAIRRETPLRVTRAIPIEPLEDRVMMSANALSQAACVDSYSEPREAYVYNLHPETATLSSPSSRPAALPSQLASSTILADAEGDVLTGTFYRQTQLFAAPLRANADESPATNPATQTAPGRYSGSPPKINTTSTKPEYRGRVLVVEDDAASRTALTLILQRRGWDVTTASTLADGMRGLNALPDSVVLDLMLPDGDGVKLLQHVRSSHMRTRVAVTTASSDRNRLARVKNLRPDVLMSKPVDLAQLLRGLSGD
jgi:CheY-like chemotaxis protein